MSKKPIIVLEGIEGSGKSFHINSVAKYLKKHKKSFIKIREPGGSNNSEKIRNLILNNKSTFKSIYPASNHVTSCVQDATRLDGG